MSLNIEMWSFTPIADRRRGSEMFDPFTVQEMVKEACLSEEFRRAKVDTPAEFEGDFSKELEKAHGLNHSGLVSFLKDDVSMPHQPLSYFSPEKQTSQSNKKSEEEKDKNHPAIAYKPPKQDSSWKKKSQGSSSGQKLKKLQESSPTSSHHKDVNIKQVSTPKQATSSKKVDAAKKSP